MRKGFAQLVGNAINIRSDLQRILLFLFLFCFHTLVTATEYWNYQIRPGDNLWNLTTRHLKHIRYWKQLQTLNGIDDPWRLRPGSELRIPIDWVSLRPASALVVATRGGVTTQHGRSGRSSPANAGTELRSGDWLITDDQGSSTLRFEDGSTLLVEANSLLKLQQLHAYGESGVIDSLLRLQQGRSESQVVPQPGPQGTRYRITTPAVSSGVRGTHYRLSAEKQGTTSAAEVLAGEVDIMVDGERRRLKAGFGLVAEAGKIPPAPKPLLSAPDLSAMPTRIDRLPALLEFSAVPNAYAYRLQVSASADFHTLDVDKQLSSNTLRLPDLPDGDYFLRVRAVAADGLEGLDAERSFTVDARPEPPVLITPQADAKMTGSRPLFGWARPATAVGYRLQLATEQKFTAPLLDLFDVQGDSVELPQELAPNSYYWRMASIGPDGEQGPWSDAQRFKRLPVAPALGKTDVQGGQLVFHWSATLPGDRYHFQLASDAAFEQPVFDDVLDRPKAAVDRPEAGIYHLRVRVLDQDGDAGPFGAVQQITVRPGSYLPLVFVSLLILVLL